MWVYMCMHVWVCVFVLCTVVFVILYKGGVSNEEHPD